MKKFRNILLAFMLLMPVAAMGVYLFKTLGARDGLTSSQINCIVKDERGFMWFGTPAGLYRYDGYNFKYFQSNSQDGASLPDSYIKSLQTTKTGDLWVETPAGYCIYHPQSETFECDLQQYFQKLGINKVPSIIYIDRNHNLWGAIPGTGVVCYNMQQQLVYEFGHTDEVHGVPQGNISSISECKDGALIVYDDGRIVCCDVLHQQHTVWANKEIADRKLRRTKTLQAFADQHDNIWLYGQGTLFLFNKSTKTWNTTIGDALGLVGNGVDHSVNSMAGDNENNIWIGTNRHGLVRCDANTLEMEFIPAENLKTERALNSGKISIQSVYVDNTDLLWVGTAKSGVAFWGKNIYKFSSKALGDITAMAQDANGKMWYGTSDDGVIDYDGPLASLKVSAMTSTPDGSIWVGSTQNGLTRIRDGVSTIYSVTRDSVRTIIDDHVNSLCTDKSGNLWIATDGGLQVYNLKMNTFSTYSRENGKMKTNTITSLYYATGNRMLVGTSEGLTIMNLSNAELTHLTGNSTNLTKFTNNYVTQLFQDSRGLIWIGTREGVNVLNLNTDNLTHLTNKEGLCNNNICGIAEDKTHNVWLTTSNGVTRVVVQRAHDEENYLFGLYNYNQSDGLLSNEFNPGSILVRNDSTVIFGGLYGTNWVRPKTKDEAAKTPLIMLTQLYLGEEEVQTGHSYDGNVVLPQALNESREIKLNNGQNTFTIKFAGDNYNQSEHLQFEYCMEGLDGIWRSGDAIKHGVTFTNLKSGTYTLRVKALADRKVADERVLKIVIDQPWYFSWWMLLVYAVIIIVSIYLWKIGIDQLKLLWSKKKAVITELERQREEIKATGDDLRQPMARMTSIISNLSERESTLEEREQLNALHSQMLQVITRVSDMQTMLEHPEEKAKTSVHSRFALNGKGELNLPDVVTSDELTAEIRRSTADSPTKQFRVLFIDDNDEFIQYISDRLKYVYEFHAYNDIRKASEDIEAIMPDIIIVKHDMRPMTGSELCNQVKMNSRQHKIKVVIMTDGKLKPQEMQSQGIAMSADLLLAKPFNLQEAVMEFNKLLGIGIIEMDNRLIEGSETRMLEGRNSSMTTATETIDYGSYDPNAAESDGEDDELNTVDVKVQRTANVPMQQGGALATTASDDEDDTMMGQYSMTDEMDRQLLKNIDEYVRQNMSRGQIALEDMAQAMGMGRVPFFHKVRAITGKTPAEVVRDLRLKNACLLLKRTNINMSELATNVGFMTAENFINIFKEKFGISPLEYRLKHRK